MSRKDNQFRFADDKSAPSNTDTSGSPRESYHWGQMAAVRREWQHEFRSPQQVDGCAMSLAEVRSIETQVRRELYP